jgi:predicted nuclease with TOPRIM domain
MSTLESKQAGDRTRETNMSTEQGKDQRRLEIEDVRAELSRLRDELRLKVHLASMDVKRDWETLEPSVNRLEDLWKDFSHDALVAARDLRSRVRAIRERLGARP